jgi:hypothetical protein
LQIEVALDNPRAELPWTREEMGILNLMRQGEDGSWSPLVEAMVTKETGDLTGMHEEKRSSLSSSEGAD